MNLVALTNTLDVNRVVHWNRQRKEGVRIKTNTHVVTL